jgi:Smg protein
MKENVLDILMYLFENHMDDEEGSEPDHESLQSELSEAGFDPHEIDKAFNWLEGLSDLQERAPVSPVNPTKSFRVFSHEERERLDVQSLGFLVSMEQFNILDAVSRELVLDRITALGSHDIDLEQVKWIVLLVLFNQPGQEAAFAWMENLVFQEHEGTIH